MSPLPTLGLDKYVGSLICMMILMIVFLCVAGLLVYREIMREINARTDALTKRLKKLEENFLQLSDEQRQRDGRPEREAGENII